MSTQYSVWIVKWEDRPNGGRTGHTLANIQDGYAWEVAPALKQLAKKIHESPPPVVLEGQEAML